MQRLHIETIFHEVRGGCNTVGARPNGRAPARRLWPLGACGRDVRASNAQVNPGRTGNVIVVRQGFSLSLSSGPRAAANRSSYLLMPTMVTLYLRTKRRVPRCPKNE